MKKTIKKSEIKRLVENILNEMDYDNDELFGMTYYDMSRYNGPFGKEKRRQEIDKDFKSQQKPSKEYLHDMMADIDSPFAQEHGNIAMSDDFWNGSLDNKNIRNGLYLEPKNSIKEGVKKKVTITESELRKIVKNAINEIGDTAKGRYNIGKTLGYWDAVGKKDWEKCRQQVWDVQNALADKNYDWATTWNGDKNNPGYDFALGKYDGYQEVFPGEDPYKPYVDDDEDDYGPMDSPGRLMFNDYGEYMGTYESLTRKITESVIRRLRRR